MFESIKNFFNKKKEPINTFKYEYVNDNQLRIGDFVSVKMKTFPSKLPIYRVLYYDNNKKLYNIIHKDTFDKAINDKKLNYHTLQFSHKNLKKSRLAYYLYGR